MATLLNAPARASDEDPRQYLIFTLDGESLAVETLSVKEIIEYGHVTTVPMMPACIRGVINLRGTVVPVMDLKARFRRGSTAITRRSCIVIVELGEESEQQLIGVVVDAVSEVLEIPASQIEPPPAFGAHMRSDFIRGMGKVGGQFVVLLEPDRVLALDELSELALDELSELALDAQAAQAASAPALAA